MSEALLDIGEVVRRTGVPTSTLHVWERAGVVAPVARAGLRRQFAPDVIDRIAMVALGQQSGFELAEIRDLLDDPGDRRDRYAAKVADLRVRRAALDRVIATLEHASECRHERHDECPDFRGLLAEMLPVRRI